MFRRLLRDSALYTLSSLLVRGLGFILLPMYVRLLSKRDFGTYDYITVLGFVVGVFVALEVAQGVMRFVAERPRGREHRPYVATAAWITASTYLVFVLSAVLLRDRVAETVLGDGVNGSLVVQVALLYTAIAFVYLWTAVARALLRPWLVVSLSVSSAALSGGLGLLLAITRNHSVEDLVLGQLIGQSLVAVAGAVVFRSSLAVGFDRRVAERLLRFSVPLVLSSVALTLSLYVDRLFVRELLGLEELAVYAVAARLAAGVALLTVGLQSALTPLIYSEAHKPETGARLASLFRWYALAGAFAVGCIGLVSGPVISFVGGPGYELARLPLIVLSTAVVVQSGYSFFPGLYIAQKTWILAAIHVLALTTNAALNPVLINRWGVNGAALATLLSACLVLGLNYGLSQRYYPIGLWSRRPPAGSSVGKAVL